MEKEQKQKDKYGLIGKDIGYSFSRGYFKNKFGSEQINAVYFNFDASTLEDVKQYLDNTLVKGYNVTIPYKEKIIPLLDGLDDNASQIGAVNTIKREVDGRLIGYNTDFIGFRDSLLPYLNNIDPHDQDFKAIILGTGGASKGVSYALQLLGIKCQFVSRKRTKENLTYEDLTQEVILDHKFIINTTPVGTFPNVEAFPNIPYNFLKEYHVVYDLIYNPPLTAFLGFAKDRGATIINGLKMLELQAKASWSLWND
ncbi:shikimate dehydrogenase family protein [Dokdonia sp. Hel_I_53]|uniref:shikimate dehydrogenase family protein n=1 Tax=Dokdonia sp. Hel_I_53 TaxID=1566287 RepID=UPI00119A61C4|nr:shikimate dehydrogenase [Dokdonia sp. Hel_I_53]TVZ50931.1 shikimate dehydrogenase [Dokdonia sp. Hel_I_53]